MRLVRLTRGFFASKNVRAPAGTPEARAVARIVAELADERFPLPGAGDVEVTIPPVLICHGRPIPRMGLMVCYSLAPSGVVVLRAVK